MHKYKMTASNRMKLRLSNNREKSIWQVHREPWRPPTKITPCGRANPSQGDRTTLWWKGIQRLPHPRPKQDPGRAQWMMTRRGCSVRHLIRHLTRKSTVSLKVVKVVSVCCVLQLRAIDA
eukprot:g61734.t1